MIKKIKGFFKINEEDLLLICASLMAFSIGIWSNYRQLWLSNNNFSLTSISRILSIALICSGIMAFIVSLFSTKIRIKDLILESLIIRSISLVILLLNSSNYIIKICVLLSIICEVIYTISFYPLFSLINKSNAAFNRKNLIEYISRDTGVILCGLLIGVVVGKRIFDYNSCLFLSLVSSILSSLFLILHKSKEKIHNEGNNLRENIGKIFKSKRNILFLIEQLLVNISYGIVFDLLLLILTEYIEFSVSFSSIFIIISNLLSSIVCSYLNNNTNYSIRKSALIKFGLRGSVYILAFISNNMIVYLFSLFFAIVTSRILEDKTLAVFINKIDSNSKFLFENIRYFICSIGEGIGALIAGILLNISLGYLLFCAGIVTILQTILLIICDNLDRKRKS